MTHDVVAKAWFKNKFKDDLSGFIPDHAYYYEHHVNHFFSKFFTKRAIKGKNILDLGCGPGFYSFRAAERGALVTGLDWNRYLVRKGFAYKRKHGVKNVRFVNKDFQTGLPRFDDESFDVVLAIDTVVSFDWAERKHNTSLASFVFKQVRRVLKDAGRFYVIETHPCFSRGKLLGPDSLRNLLPEATPSDECFRINQGHYKFRFKGKHEICHWFTLAEMTELCQMTGLAVARIREPEPSPKLKALNRDHYEYCLRYPSMIVYEVIKNRA